MSPPAETATLLCLNPRLRASSSRADGESVVVVHDPASGAYYQLGVEEYAIAGCFDGSRDLAAVAARCAEEGRQLEPAELREFASQLMEAGILVPAGSLSSTSPPDLTPEARKRLPLFSRLLHLEVVAIDARAFFAWTVDWVRPLLGGPALLLAGVLVGGAAWVTAGHGGELQESIHAMVSGVRWAVVWVLYAGIILLHEMGHGYACAHFGGRVYSLGFKILYGKPAAYCDVSDSWLMGKAQRLWIMAAGSLVELVLWAVATLVWRVAAPETWLHQIALIVMTICGIGTLFNFNPLIPLDGYYMLSDGLEVPNLRQRALGAWRRRLLGQSGSEGSPRERRIFFWYGLVAIVYTALLVGYLLARLHTWIGGRWGGMGVLVLWGTVTVAVSRPAWRLWRDIGAALRAGTRLRRLTWMGAGLGLLAILALVRWPLKVASDCRVEPRARVVVRSPIGGSVESVAIHEGDLVEAAQPLVHLATRDLDFALAGARAEEEELAARVALVASGPRRQEIELAERRAEEAATRVKFSRLDHERAQAGLQSDLVSQQSVEVSERELRLAEDEEAATRKSLELLRAGARPEELRATRARLEVVRAQVAQLEDERARTQITAPIRGQVLTAHAERLVGRYVERGDSLLVLADLGTMMLEIPVSEKDVDDVQVGARVRFKARSLPGSTFAGRVVDIAPAAEVGNRQRTVLVRSEVDNRSGVLRAGTTGYAKIYCGERRLGNLLLRRGVRTLRTEFWSLW